MLSQKKIHFEISERKILLRVFDVLSVLLALYLVGNFFDFAYFKMTKDNYYWGIVLGFYILLFDFVCDFQFQRHEYTLFFNSGIDWIVVFHHWIVFVSQRSVVELQCIAFQSFSSYPNLLYCYK
jgi:hypothetical protein